MRPGLHGSDRALAKAVHPARPAPRRAAAGSRPPGVAVLLDEEACRGWLRAAASGWLSIPARPDGLSVAIAAVEGLEILLVASGGTPCRPGGSPATLEVGGRTGDSARWVVRAAGTLRTVLDTGSSSTAFEVLALTVSGVRGFETPAPFCP